MPYHEVSPPKDASDLIRAIWWSSDIKGSLILPDGCTDIIFTPARKSIRVVGVMSHALDVGADVDARVDASASEMFGLRFHPWAARAFLGFSAEKMRDRNVRLADVNALLADIFRNVDSLAAASDVISDRLWRRALTSAPDVRVLEVVSALDANSNLSMHDVAQSSRLSERHLHRLFKEHVGLAPKAFARVMRLRDAVRASHSHPKASALAAIAATAGYADQAHFCREARALTGLAPRDLFKRSPQI